MTNPNNGIFDCYLGEDGFATYRDYCYFVCNNGYELVGNFYRYCLSDGSWSGSDPVCKIGK